MAIEDRRICSRQRDGEVAAQITSSNWQTGIRSNKIKQSTIQTDGTENGEAMRRWGEW